MRRSNYPRESAEWKDFRVMESDIGGKPDVDPL
jgi:hypothetical protein